MLHKKFFQFLVRVCCAGYLVLPLYALAQAPISIPNPDLSSPAAFQECFLAADKINKLRPNWLATSYGECRAANQCGTPKCQSEILRKQEYIVRTVKEKEEQDAAKKNISVAAKPSSDTASSSLAAIQDCYLAVDKINKLRPNWLAASYGECRAANQCGTPKCQSEILRKQEYLSSLEMEAKDQSIARSMGALMRLAAKSDPLSQDLNYIAGFISNESKVFFYPLDLRDKKLGCKVGLFDQSSGLVKASEIDLGKWNPKTLNIATSFDRDAKGFYTIFTSTVSDLKFPLICKNCTKARLEKSWQSIFSLCDKSKL